MMSNPDGGLSERGQQRRDEILTLVLAESRRVQTRRARRRRFAGGAAVVLLAAAAVWAFWSPAEHGLDRPIAGVKEVVPPAPWPGGDDLESHLVTSEVDNLDDYLVRTHEHVPAGIILDDAQLLSELAGLGRTDGIVRMGGRAWLVSELDLQLARRD